MGGVWCKIQDSYDPVRAGFFLLQYNDKSVTEEKKGQASTFVALFFCLLIRYW